MTNTTRTDLINYLRNNNIKYNFLPYGQRIIIEVKVTEETEQEKLESLKLKQLINK
tara:strand:+ start:1758 stop:1925 length:168 start_codon:yes stop_codon:yes gene_type:complete